MKTIRKSILKITVVVISVVTLISCGKDKKESETIVNDTIEEKSDMSTIDLNKTETISKVIFENENTNKVYQQYLMVKKGLVNTNADHVQKSAKELAKLLGNSEELKQLKATAELISLTKGIDKQRDFFVTLTAETEKLVSKATITSGELYKQFCPMAFNNEGGYWLSDSKEVRNPYFGNRMLKCGEVKETIK